MNDNALYETVLGAIDAQRELKSVFSRAPTAMLIPADQERRSFYLLISLCLNAEGVNADCIAQVCNSVVRVVASSGVLSGLFGLELAIYSEEAQKKPRRILRVSIKSSALATALSITPQKLLDPVSIEGISCGWY